MSRDSSIGAVLLVLMLLFAPQAIAATYYVATSGADANDGVAPAAAWRTIARVNKARFAPGDRILFNRGNTWRESLRPSSGSEAGPVTYGAYGEGLRPKLLGSVAMGDPKLWVREGEDLWASSDRAFSSDASGAVKLTTEWHLYTEAGALAKGAAVGEGGYRLDCERPGTRSNHIQLLTVGVPVTEGKPYRLTFRARCNKAVALSTPVLMGSKSPYPRLARGPSGGEGKYPLQTDWSSYSQVYQAIVTAKDGRLTFGLGDVLPAGATLEIGEFTLQEGGGPVLLPCDVGNIIFDQGATCGVKKWKPADLKEPGDYWYDPVNLRLKLCSKANPAELHASVECALGEHIIDQTDAHHVVYENLCLMYGGAHGIGGSNTHHIVVRDCDIGYIGGSQQGGRGSTVRYGNGIEFWASAHDNLVERCRLWEVYDAALTNQSGGPNTPQYNIAYRHNLIWNCEYSFEYWNRPENSLTHHIYFEHNTCLAAGRGWGHAQRPDPSGRHLCFYTSPAKLHDVYIRNNIFCDAATNAFYAPAWPPEQLGALSMDNNCWYQPGGTMILLKTGRYAMADFAKYQAEQNQERHSLAADPGLAAPAKQDFHLLGRSPCVDAGADLGCKSDFEGHPIPGGRAPDIGAFELKR